MRTGTNERAPGFDRDRSGSGGDGSESLDPAHVGAVGSVWDWVVERIGDTLR
jgi:hypothetical protein